MQTLRFHQYGPALDVLRLEDAAAPEPGPGQLRIAVEACGLNPADWALCNGLFAGELPRGIGLDVAGRVDAIGAGVTGVALGDPVFGPAPFTGPTAGASEQAVLDVWFPRPAGLGPVDAAALPMAVETAYRCLDLLGVAGAGQIVLINGAGTTVGYAAVQIALERGARVIGAAGSAYAGSLRSLGVEVTRYGAGLAERVLELVGGPVDLAFDAAPRAARTGANCCGTRSGADRKRLRSRSGARCPNRLRRRCRGRHFRRNDPLRRTRKICTAGRRSPIQCACRPDIRPGGLAYSC